MNKIINSFINQLKNLKISFLNLMSAIYYNPSQYEVALIKKTQLFASLNEQQFSRLLQFIQLIHYPKNKIIFQQGEYGDALYIIVKGSVRVFIHDINNGKIALARLNKGDYFGEQALLGGMNRTRNANIETIKTTSLIKIPEKLFSELLKQDKILKTKLEKIGFQQSINAFSKTIGFYKEIKELLSKIADPNIIDYPNESTIFLQNEKSDNAYLLLQGEVEILISDKKTKALTSVTLHPGHLFGEVGVIHNKPRSATARSLRNVRVLCISGSNFKTYLKQYPHLENILNSFQQVYQIPMRGIVEQYLGNVEEIGLAITNIFKMNDGRSIISTKSLTQDVFIMSSDKMMHNKIEHYKDKQKKIELRIQDDYLVGIDSIGYWEDLPCACQFLLDKEKINNVILSRFEKSGRFFSETSLEKNNSSDLICLCMSVTRSTIQKLINTGINTLEKLSAQSGACTVCKCCQYRILEMLGKSNWIPAVMKKIITHNANIRSYKIEPIHSIPNTWSWIPGQYIVIQVKINQYWVERAYTISDFSDGEIQLTIKKEPNGFFTEWLFGEARENFSVNMTLPQGELLLDTNEVKDALCFAGGIGITPFIAYTKMLSKNNNHKKLHIIYCALTSNDFILKDDFNKITSEQPTITIQYRPTDTMGLLTANVILDALHSMTKPDVYICGPEGFEKLIKKTLQKIDYDPCKIHVEKFVHAGSHTKKNTIR